MRTAWTNFGTIGTQSVVTTTARERTFRVFICISFLFMPTDYFLP